MKTTIFSNFDVSERYDMAKEFLESTAEEDVEVSENDIWEEVSFQEQQEYDDVMDELKKFFDGKTVLFIGTVGTWTGTHAGGRIGDFMKLYDMLREDCDFVEITDEDGNLYIRCSHHDGTHNMQVLVLTDKGKEIFDDWEYNEGPYKDYSTQKIHRLIAKNKEYSVSPMFAHKIYGVEIKEGA